MLPKSTTSSTPDTTLWQVHLPNTLSHYFRDMNFSAGYRQVIVERLLVALATRLRETIPIPCWDPENDTMIISLLDTINFKPNEPKSKSTRARRTNSKPA